MTEKNNNADSQSGIELKKKTNSKKSAKDQKDIENKKQARSQFRTESQKRSGSQKSTDGQNRTEIVRTPHSGRFWVMNLMPFMLLLIVYGIRLSIPNNLSSFEITYATHINKWTIELLSMATGLFKFSLGELILYGHVAAGAGISVLLLVRIFKGGLLKSLFRIAQYVTILYVLFMFLWGFNYQRESVAGVMGFEVSKYTESELVTLTEKLIADANRLRAYQSEDSNGVMTISGGYQQIFARARDGYFELSKNYDVFSGLYGKPKPVLASEAMLYTGITGVYFPYTAEANVNIAVPDLLLPATTLHEMAHQRGFAPEDEANFIAYIAAMAHPDKDFQYSGTILALIHTMNALYSENADDAMKLRATYSEGVDRDVIAYSAFWKSYEGKANEVADTVNDTYLKSNQQENGVKSYGKMVDLLLGYFHQ